MKTKIYFIIALCSVFFGCKKEHENHSKHTTNEHQLSINYAAAYVVNGGSNTISVIDLEKDEIRDSILLNNAKFPHHLSLSPNKKQFAVAITGTDFSESHVGHSENIMGLKIMLINSITGKNEFEIPLSKVAHNAVYTKMGNELWVGQMEDSKSLIAIYNTDNWQLTKTLTVGKGLAEISFSTDGKLAFACNASEGTVSVIDVATKEKINDIKVDEGPVGAWPAENGNMYVDNEVSQTISEISVDKKVVSQTLKLNFKPAYVAYHPILNELWITDASNGRICYYELIDKIWIQKGQIITGKDAHAVVFNSSKTKAYVTNQGENSVSVIDVNNHKSIKKIRVGSKPNGIILNDE